MSLQSITYWRNSFVSNVMFPDKLNCISQFLNLLHRSSWRYQTWCSGERNFQTKKRNQMRCLLCHLRLCGLPLWCYNNLVLNLNLYGFAPIPSVILVDFSASNFGIPKTRACTEMLLTMPLIWIPWPGSNENCDFGYRFGVRLVLSVLWKRILLR
jgi:hypothetical protein